MLYFHFLSRLVASGSEIALKRFGKVSASVKAGDRSQVVTEADLEIGNLLIGEICKTYPGHNIINEETGVIDRKSEFAWVIDPIDGTSNFANAVPLYGIMVGLLEGPLPIAGAIALPAFSEIYIGERGRGAYCNGEKVKVSGETDLASALVAYGIDGHPENPNFTKDECSLLAEIILRVRNLRVSNSVYDTAMVARGKYGAVLNRTTRIWDNVAQQIIIEEAGGIYIDFFGKPIDYSTSLNKTKENFTFCAAPPALHEQIQKIIFNTS